VYAAVVSARLSFGFALCVLVAATSARADISPPLRKPITLRLSVTGLDSFSHMSFFVSNCKHSEGIWTERPLTDARLVAGKPIVCTPKERAPVRVYGFREGDVIEMQEMIERQASTQESKKFLDEKAKYCGQLEEKDVNFLASTGVEFVDAKYTLEPFKKTGCKLSRVSATTDKKVPSDVNETTPVASTPPAPASAPIPTPAASGSPAPPKSSCGCELVGTAAGSPGLLVVLGVFLATWRRTSSRRSRIS
jgi:hypothetical protein